MKSLIVALVLCASPVFAANYGDAYDSQDLQVDFLSWCEKNNVMGQTSNGQIYIRENCSDKNLQCIAIQSGYLHRVIYTATCQPK